MRSEISAILNKYYKRWTVEIGMSMEPGIIVISIPDFKFRNEICREIFQTTGRTAISLYRLGVAMNRLQKTKWIYR